MSTWNLSTAVIAAVTRRLSFAHMGGVHLDIGAGRGELTRALARKIPIRSVACDFHVEQFQADDVPCDQVNLNQHPLPYPDGQFDVVTAREIEVRFENHRALLREAFRAMKTGGVLVLTTANAINVSSRVRYLLSGVADFVEPPPGQSSRPDSACGSMPPTPYFYLARALLDAGFEKVELSIDGVHKASVGWLVALLPFLLAGWLRFMIGKRGTFGTMTGQNGPLVSWHFSWPILVGRNIIVSAIKPAGAATCATAS